MIHVVNTLRKHTRRALHLTIVIAACICLSTCITEEGVMRPNGTVTPCNGWHTDNQACGNALFNAKQIGRIQLGQTPNDVRSLMKHDAERREASADANGNTVETWSYITDYDAEQMTTLTFTNGRLTAIGKESWKAQR